MLIASSNSLLWQNIFAPLPIATRLSLNEKIFALEHHLPCWLCEKCFVIKLFTQHFPIVVDTQQIYSSIINEKIVSGAVGILWIEWHENYSKNKSIKPPSVANTLSKNRTIDW